MSARRHFDDLSSGRSDVSTTLLRGRVPGRFSSTHVCRINAESVRLFGVKAMAEKRTKIIIIDLERQYFLVLNFNCASETIS